MRFTWNYLNSCLCQATSAAEVYACKALLSSAFRKAELYCPGNSRTKTLDTLAKRMEVEYKTRTSSKSNDERVK